MDSPLRVPPVVAVVVTCDPGPWLEETLEALAAQDYPDLSVLVIDAGSSEDPTPRVARVLPGAFVRRLGANRGYAAAANEVLEVVEGASHFLFCHDDVAPAPDAVRLMVEEAFRSNAGVVTPKLMDWQEPRRILQAGMGADKGGAPVALVDRGELDQAQHDAVRDVFVAPGGCTLVRADLFASLDGFDPEMYVYGEDLDLSWRAHIAGARVIVAPDARARHLEAMSSGRRSPGGGALPEDPETLARNVRPLQLRHRLRAVLKAYGPVHLVRVVPQLAVLSVTEIVGGVLTGHAGTARDTASAWSWNLRRLWQLRRLRRQVRRTRRNSDAQVRQLQAPELARFRSLLRGQLLSEGLARRPAARRPEAAEEDGADGLRVPVIAAAVVVVVLLAGSRGLLSGGVPAVHEFAPFPEGPFTLLREFFSGWRTAGLGSEDPAPLGFALLGLGGLLLGGATGLLQTLLVVGALPVAGLGAYRLARPLGSPRARVAAMVVYLAVPLPYNAIADGRLGGLLAYAAAPWVVSRLLLATGIDPIPAAEDGGPGLARPVLQLGVILAVVAAFVPSVVLMALLAAAGVAVGSLLAGQAAAARRAVPVALGGAGVAVLLLFPWSLGFFVPGTQLSVVTGTGPPGSDGFGFGALLRFQTGPLGGQPLGWAFLAAAALSLVIGREWRFSWAARMWALALLCWLVTWAFRAPMPVADVLLAPAAVALALAVALGMTAFELDLPGYRFGWRQAASVTALVATVAGALPVVGVAAGGRWGLPGTDFAELLSWMPEQQAKGPFRVLWLGDPQALPLGSWRLGDGVGYATSRGGPPDASSLWPGGSPQATQLVADAVKVARRRGTTRLGRLLAPMAVRYVVVPLRAAPAEADTRPLPPPADLAPTLEAQVDLEKLESDDALLVYENAAWIPGRALLGPEAVAASRGPGLDPLRSLDLARPGPVLARRSPTRADGRLARGDVVFLSEASSPRWRLRAAGKDATRTKAFGWANAFRATAGGRASLRHRASSLHYAGIVIQLALWVFAVVRLVAWRRAT